jgi:exopolyphosphatase/guanosine-5'-triphosphate,3'-diphosphate pyrophosphatase
MRVAIIDCGTNTFNLLISEVQNGGFKTLHKTKRVVKLGSQGITGRIIGDIPQQRAVDALIDLKKIIARYPKTKIIAVGTAAIRDAKNKMSFLARIKSETGIEIALISGAQEAKLIYKGVCRAFDIGSDTSLIIDIGGGSVEFIIGNNRKILWKKSFRIGAARLLELFAPSDPIKKSEITALNSFFETSLAPLRDACEKYTPVRLIGSSGSFDTIAAIILEKNNVKKSMENTVHYRFRLSDYMKLHQQLMGSTLKERLATKGMLSMRADMIVPASVLITFVLHSLKLKEMHLSNYALKEGLMIEFLNQNKK